MAVLVELNWVDDEVLVVVEPTREQLQMGHCFCCCDVLFGASIVGVELVVVVAVMLDLSTAFAVELVGLN